MAESHPIPTDPRFQDLTGRTFGKLTVLFYAGRKSGKYSLWHCRCECGSERTCVSSELTLSRATSCVSCFRHRPKAKRRSDFDDLTGKTFGRLTVTGLERHTKTIRGSRSYWQCSCSCGESTVVRGDILKDGRTVSCGCMGIVRRWRDEPKPEEKACSSCKRSLPLTLEFFYRHPSGKHGFLPRCRECIKAEKRRSWEKNAKRIRTEILTHYSGDPPRCQCPGCTETNQEFLALDHIEGGGNDHRRKIGALYPWIIRNNFPEGFRVLCHNCNTARGLYGYCPHQSQV